MADGILAAQDGEMMCNSYSIALAEEAVRAGFAEQDVLDELTTLHPKVPNSMLHRYLFRHIFKAVRISEHLFMRMVQMLLRFQTCHVTGTRQSHSGIKGTRFKSKDVPILTEFLAKHLYKWESIGTALRFTREDLKNIRHNTAAMGSVRAEQNLNEMLAAWIDGKFKYTLPPTLESLEMALNSVIVGLGVLASDVRTYFTKIQSTDIDDHSLPYYLANVHFTVDPYVSMCHIMYSKNILGQIEVDEGKSTLLECQATADSNQLNFQFQWLRNGKVISSKSEEYSGACTPTLCISCVTIDMDGSEYSCRVTPLADDARYILTRPVILRVNCVLDKYIGTLTYLYLSRPEVPKDGWPPAGRNKFINLALIKQKKTNYGTEYARLTIRGNIDDILQQKEEIQYNEMLQSLKSGQCLFIEGRPGCGKTTFVHKISQDWAATSFHGAIRIVFLVSLRVLNSLNRPKTAISDILELFDNLKLDEDVLHAREGKGVCFIFDGFDEFSPSDGSRSIVHRLINKECLKQAVIIVVSRPSATATIRDMADKVIEVVGFKNNQIFEYFDAYPFTCSPDIRESETHEQCDTCLICRKSKSLKLKSYLSQHPNILHMCYLPIHTFMVACLFEVTGKVPQTETEMYAHFTKFLVMRHLSSRSPEIDLDDVDVYNMNGTEGRHFDQICKLALEKTILNKQVLHEDEVRSFFKSEKHKDISLGLITIDCTADQLYRFKNVYTFLHLSFQEYLAAYHISTLPNQEQTNLLALHGHKTHMLMVWKFYCGLAKFKYNESKFKSILQRTESTLFHVQCAYESQQKLACAQLLKKVHYHIQLENRYLSTPDFTAIGYVTNTSLLPLRLSITDCNINSEAIDALLCEMQDRVKRELRALKYSFEAIHDNEVQCLVKLLTSFDSLKVLHIESGKKTAMPYYSSTKVQYKFTDISEMVVYNTDIKWIHLLHNLPNFTQLESVSLINCMDRNSVKLLANSLDKWSKNLRKLDISNNNINENGAMLLADGMKDCRKLEKINISNNSVTLFGVIALFESLRFCNLKLKSSEIVNQKNNIMINNGELFCSLEMCTNLQSLDTPLNSINSIETQYFSIYSKKWTNLKELRIDPYPWYQMHITTVISDCLQNFKFLQVLALMHSIFDVDSATKLRSPLKHCSDLRILDLSYNKIDSAAVERIATGLLNCGKLQELNLDHNLLSCSGAKVLALHLPNCLKLTVLSIENNGIGEDGAKAIASSCVQLQELKICGNQVGDQLSQINPALKIIL